VVKTLALTELAIKQAKPEDKTYMLTDGHGLGLEVRPDGKKYWILRYWVNRKERRTSLGPYPGVTLKEARQKSSAFRRAREAGKPIGFAEETFQTVAEEWMEKRILPKAAPSYTRTLRLRLNRLIYPALGHVKLADLTAGFILQLCRRIEDKGTVETAARVKQIIGQVFRYAIATDRADTDPTLALRGALQTRKARHYAAVTEPDEVGLLMRQIYAYPYDVVRCALALSALTFCRPGEIRQAEWAEVAWAKSEWRIPAEKMKMKRPHVVPLARQALELLEELRGYTGRGRWLFPSARGDGRPMSENAVRMALRSMGYANDQMTAHGFRAMASTNLNELGFEPDVIERQLAHSERNAVRAAYNRAEYLPERREMMQAWADWLDKAREGG
jgi:integrase